MKQIKLGFLTVHGDTENHSQMMNGVFDAAKKNNVNVIRFAVKAFDEDLDRFNIELSNLYKIIEAQKLDGIMFLGWMPGIVGEYFNDFLKKFSSIPIVSLGTKYENIPNVFANPEKCIKELLEHMIEVHGYKRIIFVPPCIPDIRNIVYAQVMERYGLHQDSLIITNDELMGIPFEDRMKKVISILIDKRKVEFDAILVMFDIEAQNLLKELKLRGIKVPSDLAIASYEDTEFANYSVPPLTTITYPWREVGFQGCEKIIKLLNKEYVEKSTEIMSKLIIRNSCGCNSNSIKLSKIQGVFKISNQTEKINYRHILKFSGEIIKAFPYTEIKIEKLLDTLVRDLEGKEMTNFLTEFEFQLQEIIKRCPYLDNVNEIEDLIYYIRNLIVSYIASDSEVLILFESIIHKAQAIIKEKAIGIIGFGQVQIKTINQQLHYVSQKLIDTLNIKEVLNILENNLPKLEISSCYIFLFNKNFPGRCNLTFKYVNYKRVIIDDTVTTSQYITDDIIEKHKNVLCQLLYVNNDYLGFIVFEPSLMDERIYQSLSLHISSALKGATILEKLKEEISLRKEKEKQLTYIANYDSLTGLFNRRCFYETINYMIDNSADYFDHYHKKLNFFLLFIDIDKFKQVNDSLGHDIGDILLIEISKRLKASLRDNLYVMPILSQDFDEGNTRETIFRLGGDEFTAIVVGLDVLQMDRVAAQLIYKTKAPYYIDGHEINISCSVGISIYPDHADNTATIIKYADIAMYQAKRQKSMYRFFCNTEY